MADRSVVVALKSLGITTYTAEVTNASRETMAYDRSLRAAGKAADAYTRAVASAGAESSRAIAAQTRMVDSLKRVSIAENDVALAAERASAAQVASSEKAAAAAEAASAKQAAAAKKVGTVFGTVGVVAAVGLGLAAKAASDFNAKQAQLEALSKASAAQMAKLSSASKQYADLGVSATAASDAEIELTKAGIGVQDQLGGALTGTLNLAAAGQMNVADATQIAATAMTQFQLAGKDIPHVADLLAAGADKALGSVGDLGYGLSQAGLPAHQLGVSIEDTVATLAEFAQAGLVGERGGTTLKQMFLRLENPTVAAAAALDKYGISLYDAQGKFVGMSNLAGQLQNGLKGVSLEERNAALATIFGSRAIQGANVLYQDGSVGAAKWAKAVNDSGFAAEQAHGKMDSLQGDMQKLSAEVQNAAIDFGQQLQPALRVVAQDLASFVGILDDIPGPLKEAAVLTIAFTAAVGLGVFAYTRAQAALASMSETLGLVATKTTAAGVAQTGLNAKMLATRAGVGLVGIGLLTLSSRISETHETLGGLTQIAGMAALGFSVGGPFGAAVGGAVGLVMNLKTAGFEASQAMDALNSTLEQNGTLSSGSKSSATVVSNEQLELLNKAGISTRTYTQALLGNQAAMGQVLVAANAMGGIAKTFLISPIDQAKDAADQYAASLFLLQGQIHHVSPAAVEAGKEIRTMGGTMSDTAGDIYKHSGAIDHDTQSTKGDTQAQKDLTAALKANQDALSHRAAMRDYADAIAAADKAQKHGNTTIRESNVLLDAQASNANNVASTMKTGTQQQIDYLERARTSLYQQAIQFGDTKAQARAYVDQVLQIPESEKTRVDIDTRAALAQLAALRAREEAMNSFTIDVNYSIRTTGGFTPGGHTIVGQAAGGEVRGVGTATSDSNIRALSKGEFVTRTAAAQSVGYGVMHEINRTGRIPQGLANGGQIGRGWTSGGGHRATGASTITVQAPAGPFRVTFDLGNGKTLTGVMRQEAQTIVNNTAAWNQP